VEVRGWLCIEAFGPDEVEVRGWLCIEAFGPDEVELRGWLCIQPNRRSLLRMLAFGFHQLIQLTRMQLNAVTTIFACGLDAYLQQLSAAAELTPGLAPEVLHLHTSTSVQKLCLLSL